MIVKITCINKSNGYHENPYEAVSQYGWIDQNAARGVTARQEMVNWLKLAENQAYVEDGYGNRTFCRVLTSRNGIEFLQTYSDNTPTDNLLSLRECIR